MSQTDSNAFDFREAREAAMQRTICQCCRLNPCDCEPNDESSMLTDDDLLED